MAGAALSLLAVTVVFAIHVSSGAMHTPPSHAVFVHEPPPAASGAPARRTHAVVVRAAPAAKPAAGVARRRRAASALRARAAASRARQPTSGVSGVSELGPAAPPPAAPTAEPRPATGDGVRTVGDALSAKVHGTAGANAPASVPLGPPVNQAVQNALDLVPSLLDGASTAVRHAADSVLAQR